MSYIRCLSNPEGLYIWEDEDKVFIISMHDDSKIVPLEAWNKVFSKISQSGFESSFYLGEVVERDGFRIQIIDSDEGTYVYMSYKNKWEIKMWEVTFDAIKLEVIRNIVNDKFIKKYFIILNNKILKFIDLVEKKLGYLFNYKKR